MQVVFKTTQVGDFAHTLFRHGVLVSFTLLFLVLSRSSSAYIDADSRARAYYQANKNATFASSDDDEFGDLESGVFTKRLLSYQPYWGCVLEFPHCRQADVSRAHCKKTCKEYNRRARSGKDIPKQDCSGLPSSDCSFAHRSRQMSSLVVIFLTFACGVVAAGM